MQHFFFYDEGTTPDLPVFVKSLADAGLGSVQPLPVPVRACTGGLKCPIPHEMTNVMWRADCLQRAQSVSDWGVFIDVDEFLWTRNGTTLRDLMRRADDRVQLFSFGSITVRPDVCGSMQPDGSVALRSAPSATWANDWRKPGWGDGLVVRHALPVCSLRTSPPSRCVSFYGHRKYLLRLQGVAGVSQHDATVAAANKIDFDTADAHLLHVRGLANTDQLCQATQLPPRILPRNASLANATQGDLVIDGTIPARLRDALRSMAPIYS